MYVKAIRTTQKDSKKLFAIILASAIAVSGLGYLGYAYTTKNVWPFAAHATKTVDGINYSPSTEQEVRDSQDGKKNSENQDESKTTPDSSTTVSVGIAYAGYSDSKDAIDIRAFTPNVVEGDGTCTATLTKDRQTITRTSKAFIDSSSSQCEPILINTSEFPAGGIWTLTVSYKSNTSNGASTPVEVEVSQ